MGRSQGVEATDFTRPHPNPPPLGEGIKINDLLLVQLPMPCQASLALPKRSSPHRHLLHRAVFAMRLALVPPAHPVFAGFRDAGDV